MCKYGKNVVDSEGRNVFLMNAPFHGSGINLKLFVITRERIIESFKGSVLKTN